MVKAHAKNYIPDGKRKDQVLPIRLSLNTFLHAECTYTYGGTRACGYVVDEVCTEKDLSLPMRLPL